MRNFLSNERKIIVFIFLLALLVRIIYILTLGPEDFSPDGGGWIAIARNLIEGKGYGDAWRPPVYSFFLAGIFWVFGYCLLAVRVIQSIIGALTAVSIYYIGKKLFKKEIGLISGIIVALYPYLIYYTGDILKETLFTFLISLTILSILLAVEKPTLKRHIIAGMLYGITVLCKATIFPFYGFLFLWFIVIIKNVKSALWISLFLFLTIIPWSVRNTLYWKGFVLFSPDSGRIFWESNNPNAINLENIPRLNVKRLPREYSNIWHVKEDFQRISKLPKLDANKEFFQEGIKWIKNDPETFRELVFKRLLHYWRLYPMVATKTNKIIAMVTSGPILLLGWLGIVLSWKKWRKTTLLIFLLVSFTLVHIIFFAMIRYRVPIDPYIIIFASYSIWFFKEKII